MRWKIAMIALWSEMFTAEEDLKNHRIERSHSSRVGRIAPSGDQQRHRWVSMSCAVGGCRKRTTHQKILNQ